MINFEKLGKKIRKDILRLCFKAESGHIGGPLGAVELYLSLYFLVLNERVKFNERDRVVISNGHYSALLYSILYQKGLISLKELNSFRIFKGLQGHPKRDESILVETSSGPLGEGLGQAIGIAKLNLIENNPGYVYCLMGDGEQAEGSV
jgi:transketolase